MRKNNINLLGRQFSEMAKTLTPKELAKAMRGGLRIEANKVKRKAQVNMFAAASSKLDADSSFKKSIRAIVPRELSGFLVTALGNRKTGKGMYKTRRHGLKPIALWADAGTDIRHTRSHTGNGRRRISRGKGHSTGKMLSLGGVLQATENTEIRGVETRLTIYIGQRVLSVAKKKGLQ